MTLMMIKTAFHFIFTIEKTFPGTQIVHLQTIQVAIWTISLIGWQLLKICLWSLLLLHLVNGLSVVAFLTSWFLLLILEPSSISITEKSWTTITKSLWAERFFVTSLQKWLLMLSAVFYTLVWSSILILNRKRLGRFHRTVLQTTFISLLSN